MKRTNNPPPPVVEDIILVPSMLELEERPSNFSRIEKENSHLVKHSERCTETCQGKELLINQPLPPSFGSISVVNSEAVHFGNRTYLNGPITVKNLVTSINSNEIKKEQKDVVKTNIFSVNTWKILMFVLFFIIVLSLTIYITIVKTVEYYKENKEVIQQEDAPFIAPHILRFVSRSDWLAQPVESPLDVLKHPTPWVIIIHTVTRGCTTQSDCILLVRNMQTFHIESKLWLDIGYNYLIGGDGSVYVGRGWDYIGAHTRGYNNISIGIAFIGTFNQVPPTPNQLDACQKLIREGVTLGKLSEDYKLVAHRQLMATKSPGSALFNIMQKWPHFVKNKTELQPYFYASH